MASTLENLPVPELTAEAAAYLESYRWPGNVRELKNVAERLVVRYSDRAIAPQDLPREIIIVESQLSAAAPGLGQGVVDEFYHCMTVGRESFWTAVYEPFIRHDMTRDALRAIVRRALEQTRGSYPLVASLFNLPAHDYPKFIRFLHKHDCHLPIQPFRMLRDLPPPAPGGADAPTITGREN